MPKLQTFHILVAKSRPMRRKVILLVFFLVSCTAHSQWRQLQDSLLMQGAFNSICSINGKWIAGTKSGLYLSENADFKWKHLSSLHYYEVRQVFNVDSVLFAHCFTHSGEKLLRSYDLGKHWDTLSYDAYDYYNNKRYVVIGRSIFHQRTDIEYSTDYGDTWHSAPYFVQKNYYYYVSQNNGIVGSWTDKDSTSSSYSYSADGIYFQRILDTTFSRPGNAPFFARSGNTVFIIRNGKILQLDTLTKTIIRAGATVGLEAATQYSPYNVIFLNKAGGYWYLGYNKSASDANYIFIYKSTDLANWTLVTMIPGESEFTTQIQFPDEKALIIASDTADLVIDQNGYGYRPQQGIPPANVQLMRFRNILMARNAGTGQPVMIWNRREIGLLINREDSARLLSAINYMQPVAKGTGSIIYSPHHVLTVDTSGSLYVSADSGKTWEDITYGVDFKENRPDLITEYRNSFLTLAFNKTQSHHFTYYLDPEKRQWRMVAFVEFAQRTDLFTVAGGTAVGAFPGFESDLFTLDMDAGVWKKAPATGLPYGTYRFIPAGNNILAFEGSKSLYISTDAAQSFSRDTTLPDGVNLHFQFVITGGLSVNFGWIDSALFISTNAGVWYNTSLYYPYTDDFRLSPYSFQVFPNPATDHFSVRYTSDGAQPCYLTVMDMTGKLCKTYELQPGIGDLQWLFPREGLRKGMYVLQLKSGSSIQTRKLVLE